jgi:hypothetical protein
MTLVSGGRRALGVLLGLGVVAAAGPALAQQQVALMPVKGPATAEVATTLVASLPAEYQLVPQKQTNFVVDRASRPPALPQEFSLIARKLRAVALIDAFTTIESDGLKMRLNVRKGASGAVVGSVDFKGVNKAELVASIARRGPVWLKALVDRSVGVSAPPQNVATNREAPAPERETESEPVARQERDSENPLDRAGRQREPMTRAALVERQRSGRRQGRDDDDRRQSRRDDEGEPGAEGEDEENMDARAAPARRSGSLANDDADEELEERGSRGDSEAPPMWEMSVGPRMMARAFVFTDNVSGLPGFNLPAAPGIFGEAEFFPAARSRGATKNFGFSGMMETSVGAKTVGRDGNRSVATKAQSFRVGPRYRFMQPNFTVTLGADYGQHEFSLDVDDTVPPNVAYTLFRPSVAWRIFVSTGLSLGLSAAYLHILEVGGLGDKERFPNITARGAEVGAILGYEVGPDFELRLQADLRHYTHNYHVKPGDPFVVGGAVDEHFGAALLLTYRMR